MTNATSRVLLAWSSGKDSGWALHLLQMQPGICVVGLLTTIRSDTQRVGIHNVHRRLVEEQADAAGLPLFTVDLPWPCPNSAYEEAMHVVIAQAQDRLAVTHIAFGDLFLEEIRLYRERIMAAHKGIELLFPLWNIPTQNLAEQMIANGLRARVVCVDRKKLPQDFVFREFNAQFLSDLPPGIDPCGENGEFHTFAFDGPMFTRPVDIIDGEMSESEDFYFAGLVPPASRSEAFE